MRPSVDTPSAEVYECFDCGRRTEAPQSRVCANCGGDLLHLGRSRDL